MGGEGVFGIFMGWTAVVAFAGFLWGNNGFSNDLAEACNKHNEMVISGTVFQCKPVALIIKGVRAELK